MENMEKELEEREIKELELMNENENREFYVYVHIRLDNNTVFYVGKGTKNRAYKIYRGEGTHHDNICKAVGCKVVIIKNNLTENQAFRLENKMIEYYVHTLGYGIDIEGYKDYDHALPHLTNRDWGGEGGKSGIQFSEEHKQNLSESHKGKMVGKKNPMFGKNAYANKTEEEMEEIRRKKSESMKGIKFSEERNKKISKAQSKKVICITTGEEFDSIKDAAIHYNISQGNISSCCIGTRKHAGKLNGVRLQWKYLEEDDNESKVV